MRCSVMTTPTNTFSNLHNVVDTRSRTIYRYAHCEHCLPLNMLHAKRIHVFTFHCCVWIFIVELKFYLNIRQNWQKLADKHKIRTITYYNHEIMQQAIKLLDALIHPCKRIGKRIGTRSIVSIQFTSDISDGCVQFLNCLVSVRSTC